MMISVVSWLVEGEDKGDACYLFIILTNNDDIGCFLIGRRGRKVDVCYLFIILTNNHDIGCFLIGRRGRQRRCVLSLHYINI